MRTGLDISNCKKCATQTRFNLDDRWEYHPETQGYQKLMAVNKQPKFCPICGSDEVEFTEEKVDFYEWSAQAAGFTMSPDVIALVHVLYEQWNHLDSFVEFLVEFKKAVTSNQPG